MRNLLLLALLMGACGIPKPAEPTVSDPGIDPEAVLEDLGIVLPDAGAPMATYVNAVRTGNLLFLAGKAPSKPDGGFVTGRLGDDLTIEEGYEAARLTAIQHLAVLEAELGTLRRVHRIVRVTGMVNATPEFTGHSAVVNGYSDLMGQVFGERGRHARSAIGVGSLPLGIAVEIEAIVEIE